MQKSIITLRSLTFFSIITIATCMEAEAIKIDKQVIEKAAGTQVSESNNILRIGWSRQDVTVEIDGITFPPEAGLGSWAAFQPINGDKAMVMGDTVVFQDEVDAAMDAAFVHGLKVTALHNHFFYDEPKVYFMHIGGQGPAAELATAVKAVWDAIKNVRSKTPEPAKRFSGTMPNDKGEITAKRIQDITGLIPDTKSGGVVKISSGRIATIQGTKIGGKMGLSSWAAFSGNDTIAVMDGDMIMTGAEVQPVLQALRKANLHVVALHNHMINEQQAYFFTHFWGKGSVTQLAKGFKAAIDELQQ